MPCVYTRYHSIGLKVKEKLDYIPLMRYGIGTIRDNQRTWLSLV